MTVGIAEVKAGPAARPLDSALDSDAPADEPRTPAVQIRGIDGERQVHLSIAVVRRNHSSRNFDRLERRPLAEQQQHLLRVHAQGAEAVILHQPLEAEQLRIKSSRSVDVIHIERRLHNLVHLHSVTPPSTLSTCPVT